MDPNNPLNPQSQPNPAAPTPAPGPLAPEPIAPQIPASPTPTWPLPTAVPMVSIPTAPPSAPSWDAFATPTAPAVTPAPDITSFQSVPPPQIEPMSPVADNSFTPMPMSAMDTTSPPPGAANGPPPWATPSMDNGPTDLSQLIGNASATSPADSSATEMPAATSPADVASQVPAPAPQVVTNEGGKGFPKWMIAAGLGIVVVVAAASAYFILGIGKPASNDSTSLPAEQQPLTNPPRTTNPSPQPEASTSATFGELQGSTPSATATSSGKTSIDILKERAASGQ